MIVVTVSQVQDDTSLGVYGACCNDTSSVGNIEITLQHCYTCDWNNLAEGDSIYMLAVTLMQDAFILKRQVSVETIFRHVVLLRCFTRCGLNRESVSSGISLEVVSVERWSLVRYFTRGGLCR